MSLIIHAGGYVATEEQVRATQTPEVSQTWQPVPHAALLDNALREIEAMNMRVKDQAFALWNEGKRMFGYLEVVNGHNQPDYGMVIGLRNSHDQTLPVGLAVGHRVFICDNLAFSGEVVISHKHTSRVLEKMPILMGRAMNLLIEKRGVQDRRISAYKDCQITDREAHDLMIRSLDSGIVAPSRLREVVDQWRKPAYPDFEPRTAWSLFNAYTYVLKEHPVMDHQRRTLNLHYLTDQLAGINVEELSQQAHSAAAAALAEIQEGLDEDATIVAPGLGN